MARLNTRRLDQAISTELPGTDGARGPFLSPDGQWVGFWASGSLKKTAIDGGSPVVLCDAVDLSGASWGGDGNIIAALSFGKLSTVPSSSGRPKIVADLTHESVDPRWPQVLPDGRHVLFTAVGPQGPNGANIESIEDSGTADPQRKERVLQPSNLTLNHPHARPPAESVVADAELCGQRSQSRVRRPELKTSNKSGGEQVRIDPANTAPV